jgi:DNA mismatch repair protein MutS
MSTIGVAAADVSTGELRLCVTSVAELDAVLARYAPREILLPERSELPLPPSRAEAMITEREAWEFDAENAAEDLRRHYRVQSLEGLGIGAGERAAIAAAGALIRYLRELQPAGVPQLARPVIDRSSGLMPLDEMTRRNLELVESLRGGGQEGTLLSVLDRTVTPMGARLLRQWVLAPLTDRAAIEERLETVGLLFGDALAREALRSALDGVRDIERLGAKIASGRATPRDVVVVAQRAQIDSGDDRTHRRSLSPATLDHGSIARRPFVLSVAQRHGRRMNDSRLAHPSSVVPPPPIRFSKE